MDKRFWAIIGIIVAVFAGILLFGGDKDADKNKGGSGAKPTSHLLGNTAASVKLVEYGDYQCPFCAIFNPVVKELVQKYGDKVSFQYRHFPLSQTHKNALAAARAAEAADKQNKFWEMHDMLFSNQESWKEISNAPATFESYAKQLGLNQSKFKEDFVSSEANARINADKAEFNKTKLPASTPTFILNGKRIQPEASVPSFSKFIDEALKKQN
jgi:protein-disulfide isomerase